MGDEINDFGDPLLYMEAIPYWETRSYVAIVMRNYWMYERQAARPSPSRMALAQNQFPMFPRFAGRPVTAYCNEEAVAIMIRGLRPMIALLTVSDTRGPEDDTSGDMLAARITGAGHTLASRALLKDDADLIARQLRTWIADPAVDAVISTGGTGLTGRDVTPEALAR